VKARDRCEFAIRRLHALEVDNGSGPVIDYDCAPMRESPPPPYPSRLAAFDDLGELLTSAPDSPGAEQIVAHRTYLAALLGEQRSVGEYIQRTQGCEARGWSEDYIQHRRELARDALAVLEIGWDENSRTEMRGQDEQLAPADTASVIRDFAKEYEPRVRELANTQAEFNLTIETVNQNAYWSYWLDGSGHDARLRINVKNAAFVRTDAYRFALHEVLGHALQYASIATYAERVDVEWPRLLAVHSTHQVLCEGLAQLLPLALRPDDPRLVAAARLDHYLQLVRAKLHLLINSGASIGDCRECLQRYAPMIDPGDVEGELRDRSRDPQFRSYLWAYPAGIDWFINVFEQRATLLPEVLGAAYERPLNPSELRQFWPDGPAIGGDA
jgi:hypothetical protein